MILRGGNGKYDRTPVQLASLALNPCEPPVFLNHQIVPGVIAKWRQDRLSTPKQRGHYLRLGDITY
jgi:hypothetical protein